MPRLLIAGCGYLGEAVAELFARKGWDVTGVTRSVRPAMESRGAAMERIVCDIGDAQAVQGKLGGSTWDVVVDCVSSRGGGPDDYRHVYLDGARNLLGALECGRFVFTSSTSVYAQVDGSVVTESSEANPTTETGRFLRLAEDLVLAARGTVARLAGLYGPGRSAHLRKLRDGTAVIEGDGGRWINAIHRDDAARAMWDLVGAPPGIYNIAGEPVQEVELYRALSRQLGIPEPATGPRAVNRRQAWTNKRISSAKLRGIGWCARYPTITDAVAAGAAG
jgi:nucleoside-diphosphate-sugar epimerase